MATETFTPLKGHCTCQTITYEILAPILCTHCCHCTWCQRETGTAFALNSMIETSNFRITSETKPVVTDTPSASGNGQMIARCPRCLVAIYSNYGGNGNWITFVRVGTLDDAGKMMTKPDVHIFTSTKMDWVDLTAETARGVPIMDEYYQRKQVWKKDAMERFALLKQKMDEAKKAQGESKI